MIYVHLLLIVYNVTELETISWSHILEIFVLTGNSTKQKFPSNICVFTVIDNLDKDMSSFCR